RLGSLSLADAAPAPAAWQHKPANSTAGLEGTHMSSARDLANFVTRITPSDLPAQAMDYAAMLIASTIASAAMGSGLDSARIVKDMARSLGGSPRASLWFDGGPRGADR